MRRSIAVRVAWVVCVTAVLLVAVLPTACGDDGTGPEDCTGTCIVVINQSAFTITDVYFRSCSDVRWGEERLLDRNRRDLDPGEQEEWSVTAGCWDILVQAPGSGIMLAHHEADVEIGTNERHVCTVTF